MKLAYYKEKWYATYGGLIYTNAVTDIHTRINNKARIAEIWKITFKHNPIIWPA